MFYKETFMEDQQLPLTDILSRSIQLLKQHALSLIRITLPFICTLILIDIYFNAVGLTVDTMFSLESLGLLILYSLTATLAAVGAHRLFLLPKETAEETNILHWSARETRFLTLILLITLFAIIAMIIPAVGYGIILASLGVGNYLDSLLMDIPIMAPVYYLLARWGLVLPSTAIDSPKRGFGWAWRLSKGHSLRLFLLMGVIPMIIGLMLSLLPEADNLVITILYSLIWLPIAAFELCLLSLSFSYLSKWQKEAEQGTTEFDGATE